MSGLHIFGIGADIERFKGPCYFINDKANNQLVEESYKHPEFKLEDMFVTGK